MPTKSYIDSHLAEAVQETNYLMKSQVNAARLVEGINEVEAMIAKKNQDKTK